MNSSYLRGPYRKYVGREGLEVTTLGLQFKVEAEHFKGGDMKLKCLATIATVYWKSNEESVEGEKQQKPPVMEIKRTELEDNNSRADRVQGKCKKMNKRKRYTKLNYSSVLFPCFKNLQISGYGIKSYRPFVVQIDSYFKR